MLFGERSAAPHRFRVSIKHCWKLDRMRGPMPDDPTNIAPLTCVRGSQPSQMEAAVDVEHLSGGVVEQTVGDRSNRLRNVLRTPQSPLRH